MWTQRETRENPGDPYDKVDIYAVGVLYTIITVWRCVFVKGLEGKRWRLAWKEIRKESRYIWGYCIKQRNWRALRQTVCNGYLAEHRHGLHNCGTGWTKNRAFKRSMKLCHESACLRFHPDAPCNGSTHPTLSVRGD